MELKIKVYDIFPSMKELSKDCDLIININELEFFLKDIINKDILLNTNSIINISIKKEFPIQILGEGKIDLNKIPRISLNKNFITWLKLSKEKKIKKNKNDILNNILDIFKIKIQLSINKEKNNNKTNYFPTENYNKTFNNKEIKKTKSPIQKKFNSIYSNNVLLKNYGKIDFERNEKSFSNKKKHKKNNSLFYNKSNLALSNTIIGKINYTSKSFIKDNDDNNKYKKKLRTHSRKNSSKSISKIGKNLLKQHISKEIEEFNTQFQTEESNKVNKLERNLTDEINKFKRNLNDIFQENKDNNKENNDEKNKENNNKNNKEDENKNQDFQSIDILDIILSQNDDINIKEINDEELNIQDDNLIDCNQSNHSERNLIEQLENNIDLINKEFLNLKNDFDIFYTKDYFKEINHNFLQLEIELCFEKIFELIFSYHKTLKIHNSNIINEQKNLKNYIKDIKIINKQISKLKVLNEIYTNNQYYLNISNEINFKKINLFKQNFQIEFDLFKNLLKEKKNNKTEKLKDIFPKIYLKNYHSIKDSETKTIIKTMFPDLKHSFKKSLSNETLNKKKRNISHSKGIKTSVIFKKENKNIFNSSFHKNLHKTNTENIKK